MTSAAAFRGKADPEGGDGGVLRDAITEAMRAKTDETPGIKRARWTTVSAHHRHALRGIEGGFCQALSDIW